MKKKSWQLQNIAQSKLNKSQAIRSSIHPYTHKVYTDWRKLLLHLKALWYELLLYTIKLVKLNLESFPVSQFMFRPTVHILFLLSYTYTVGLNYNAWLYHRLEKRPLFAFPVWTHFLFPPCWIVHWLGWLVQWLTQLYLDNVNCVVNSCTKLCLTSAEY